LWVLGHDPEVQLIFGAGRLDRDVEQAQELLVSVGEAFELLTSGNSLRLILELDGS
jgi:hypothetical protein